MLWFHFHFCKVFIFKITFVFTFSSTVKAKQSDHLVCLCVVDPYYCPDITNQVALGNAFIDYPFIRTVGSENTIGCNTGYSWTTSVDSNLTIQCRTVFNQSQSYGAWIPYVNDTTYFSFSTLCKCTLLLSVIFWFSVILLVVCKCFLFRRTDSCPFISIRNEYVKSIACTW